VSKDVVSTVGCTWAIVAVNAEEWKVVDKKGGKSGDAKDV
jgi:hypothetical protein